MKKLFATDFDGTLSRDGISPRSREAVARFRAGGGVFGVVTGRGGQCAVDIFREIETDFVSCANGTVLALPDGRCEVFARYGADTVRRLWEAAISLGSVNLFPQTERASLWIDTDDASGREKLEGFIAEHGSFCHCNMLFPDNDLAAGAMRALLATLGDEVNPLLNGRVVDIPPRGIDKGEGVRLVAGHFGIAEDMIYTAGNEMNDYAMVSAFHGFAMEGSPEALVAAAERVIGDVADALGEIIG